MQEPGQIRLAIQRARRAADQHEANAAAQSAEIKAAKKQLVDLLKCKPGQEKEAIRDLRSRIESNQDRVEELLREAEDSKEEVGEES